MKLMISCTSPCTGRGTALEERGGGGLRWLKAPLRHGVAVPPPPQAGEYKEWRE